MPSNVYLEALRRIPKGQTRSFMELAAIAGRPGAARAAGRAMALCPANLPRHRVVDSRGRPRDDTQLQRLRHEGARARAGESIEVWARRVGALFVGRFGTRELARPLDASARKWRANELEALPDLATANARGFHPDGKKALYRGVPLPTRRSHKLAAHPVALATRIERIEWERVRASLRAHGIHRIPGLISGEECRSILHESARIERFDRTTEMAPKGYGVGTYHYYTEPLPTAVGAVRERAYRELAPAEYPETLAAFWNRCREAGQKRTSSILICYGAGGVNHPHRDVYGRVWFPYQALVMLSQRGRDFGGGEFFVEDESTGRRQVAEVSEGDLVFFSTRERIERDRKVPVRHGMQPVTRGKRYGLGIVFHLAE